MKKVKIIKLENAIKGSYGDEVDFSYVANQTDWKEVSDKEYDSLFRYCAKHQLTLISSIEGKEFETCLNNAIKLSQEEERASEASRKIYERQEAERKAKREKKKQEMIMKQLEASGYEVIKKQ